MTGKRAPRVRAATTAPGLAGDAKPYKWRDPARRAPSAPPSAPPSVLAAIARAVTHPGLVTDRRVRETNADWQARAVLETVEPFIRADERKQIIDHARARTGDELAQIVADIIGEDQP